MKNFEKVKQILAEKKIPHTLRTVDTDDYSVDAHVKALDIKYREGLSTLIFRVKGGSSYFALLRRDDRNVNSKAIKKLIGTGDFTFANKDDMDKLGLEIGLASPFLLPELQEEFELQILVDAEVKNMTRVICGSGDAHHAIEVQKNDLLKHIGSFKFVEVTIQNKKRQDNFEGTSEQSIRKRILTGDRPTGPLHLGHYVGSLKNRVYLQDEYETFIMCADVQAFTDNFDNPEKVRQNVYQVIQDNLAVGLDPEKVTFFIQSAIPEIAELTVFFMNLVSHSEVLRNPTVKNEIKEKGFGDSTPFGFVAYPVSQAADINFLRSHLVPVGDDQKPMIELTRLIARKFNATYGVDVFPQVEGEYSNFGRLVGTDGNSKMSKSLGNVISLSNEPESVKKQVMSMYTDPNRLKTTDPGTVEGNPVFIYHDAFNTNTPEVEELKERYRNGTVGDVEVKQKLADAINLFLEPIRERRKQFPIDIVKDIVAEGNKRAKAEAEITMGMVRSAMKINY